MLIQVKTLREIRAGRITLAYRRWKRPTVKTGGTLRTVVGVLSILSVERIAEKSITKRDAVAAGFESRKELLDELNKNQAGSVYRVKLRHLGEDPRAELCRVANLTEKERINLKNELDQLDSRSRSGDWTIQSLKVIQEYPERRAAELADALKVDPKRFKLNVRKLKELGLTESLAIGYRLSARGEAFMNTLCHSK